METVTNTLYVQGKLNLVDSGNGVCVNDNVTVRFDMVWNVQFIHANFEKL